MPIFAPVRLKEAFRSFREWEAKSIVEEERAVRCIKKDLFHCLYN